MTGELDNSSAHAVETRSDLAELDIPTGLVFIPGAPHAFLGQQRAFNNCVEAADDFFAKHLKIEAQPKLQSNLMISP
jgi:hypothetical protein